jgi:hypothetical protein
VGGYPQWIGHPSRPLHEIELENRRQLYSTHGLTFCLLKRGWDVA